MRRLKISQQPAHVLGQFLIGPQVNRPLTPLNTVGQAEIRTQPMASVFPPAFHHGALLGKHLPVGGDQVRYVLTDQNRFLVNRFAIFQNAYPSVWLAAQSPSGSAARRKGSKGGKAHSFRRSSRSRNRKWLAFDLAPTTRRCLSISFPRSSDSPGWGGFCMLSAKSSWSRISR